MLNISLLKIQIWKAVWIGIVTECIKCFPFSLKLCLIWHSPNKSDICFTQGLKPYFVNVYADMPDYLKGP